MSTHNTFCTLDAPCFQANFGPKALDSSPRFFQIIDFTLYNQLLMQAIESVRAILQQTILCQEILAA